MRNDAGNSQTRLEKDLSCLTNYLYAAERDLEAHGSSSRALAAVKAANACTREIIQLTARLRLTEGGSHAP